MYIYVFKGWAIAMYKRRCMYIALNSKYSTNRWKVQNNHRGEKKLDIKIT